MPIIVRSKRTENRYYIDNEFLNGYAKNVKWQGHIVYSALCRHERSGRAFPSLKHLADELGTSVSSVRRGVDGLKKYNIVQIERLGKTLNNIYWIIDYKEWRKLSKSEWSNRTISRVSVQGEHSECSIRKSECSPVAPNNTNKNNTNITITLFDQFYSIYPKKIAKEVALKSFTKLKIDEALLQVILKDVKRRKRGEAWVKDNGRYIPYPATYLNQKRWEDEEENKTDFLYDK